MPFIAATSVNIRTARSYRDWSICARASSVHPGLAIPLTIRVLTTAVPGTVLGLADEDRAIDRRRDRQR